MLSLVGNADQQTDAVPRKARKCNAIPRQKFISFLILKFIYGFDVSLLYLEQEFWHTLWKLLACND